VNRQLKFVVGGLGCALSAGCYQKVSEPNGLEYSFQIWVPAAVFLGGLAALPVGILIFAKKSRLMGVAVAVGALLAAVVLAP
jgi:hypothetical protein